LECGTNGRLPEEPVDCEAVEEDVHKIRRSILAADVAGALCGAAGVAPLARREPVRLAQADGQDVGPAADD
jgi:hypothetical protein